MKILITTDLYTPAVNGVVTSVLNLRKELLKRGHDVRILTLSQNLRSYESDDVTYLSSFNAERVYPGARVKAAFHSTQIRKLIAWRPDVIHTQCEFSTFLIAKKIAKTLDVPIIHTYHTVYEDYTHYLPLNPRRGKQIVSLLSRRILNQCTSVVAPTEKVRAILDSYGIKRDIHVVPTGIDLSRASSVVSDEQLSALRHQLGISDSDRILLFVGRIAKEKNLDEVLQNLAHIQMPDLKLVIVGDGPYRTSIEQLARGLGIADQVIFTGMIAPDRVFDYYHLADLFVNASTSETQGLTYLESLASGLPALCRQDSCLDGVIVDGFNGWQYRAPEEFAQYLSLYFEDEALRIRLKQNASEYAFQTFSSGVFAQNIERIYLSSIDTYYAQRLRIRLLS